MSLSPYPFRPTIPNPTLVDLRANLVVLGPCPHSPQPRPPPFPQTTPRSPNPTKLTSSHRPQPDPLPDTTPPRPHLLTIGDIKNTSTPLHVSGDVAAASGARFFYTTRRWGGPRPLDSRFGATTHTADLPTADLIPLIR